MCSATVLEEGREKGRQRLAANVCLFKNKAFLETGCSQFLNAFNYALNSERRFMYSNNC